MENIECGDSGILLTCGVHREKVVSSQLFFGVELADFFTDLIRIGVHQTGKGDRPRADAIKRKLSQGISIWYVAPLRKEREHLLIPGSSPQIIVIKQFTPQPTPRNVHPHTIERSFNTRICHLLRKVRSKVRMRYPPSDGPKSPTGRTTNRVGVAGSRTLLCGVTRRNLNADRSPVISIGRSGRCDVGRSRWDTSGDREGVLDGRGRVFGCEGPELVMVSLNLLLVRLELVLKQGGIVEEELGLSGGSNFVEVFDVLTINRLEGVCQHFTILVQRVKFLFEVLPWDCNCYQRTKCQEKTWIYLSGSVPSGAAFLINNQIEYTFLTFGVTCASSLCLFTGGPSKQTSE